MIFFSGVKRASEKNSTIHCAAPRSNDSCRHTRGLDPGEPRGGSGSNDGASRRRLIGMQPFRLPPFEIEVQGEIKRTKDLATVKKPAVIKPRTDVSMGGMAELIG